MGVAQNGWFTIENPINMDDFSINTSSYLGKLYRICHIGSSMDGLWMVYWPILAIDLCKL